MAECTVCIERGATETACEHCEESAVIALTIEADAAGRLEVLVCASCLADAVRAASEDRLSSELVAELVD